MWAIGRFGMLSWLLQRSALFVVAAALSACVTLPQPLTREEVGAASEGFADRNAIEAEPVLGPIDIHEAIARSIKYNLDYRIEAAQAAIQRSEYEISNISMLPQIAASAGYSSRSSFSASSSLNLQTGVENFSASTSQDKRIRTADIEISWNIIDFGLSYIRAKQAGDKALIGDELKRKVMQRMMADVTEVFGRALSLQRLTKRMTLLAGQLKEALINAKSASASLDVSRTGALMRQRELLELQRRTIEIKRELVTAKADLAALMNLRPTQSFMLSDVGWEVSPTNVFPSLNDAVDLAVNNRPEVMENLYQKRINTNEATAALIDLLPGLKTNSSNNFDSNSFLLNNNWVGAGASVAANLIKVFSYPLNKSRIELQGELLDLRGRALSLAITTQVHASYARYAQAYEQFKIASEYREVQKSLLQQLRSEAEANKISAQYLVREKLNDVIADAQYDLALSALAVAACGIRSSIGIDQVDSSPDEQATVYEIAANLRSAGQHWQQHTKVVRRD
jgi:outer membrane protein TolC